MQIGRRHSHSSLAIRDSVWRRLTRLARKAYGRDSPAHDASGRREYHPRPATEAETMDRQ
jgi:hypothetical protein